MGEGVVEFLHQTEEMMKVRYAVVSGSQSAHCCFEATVVDLSKPVIIGGAHYEEKYESVCECFDGDDADKIAAALNAISEEV